MKYSNLFEDADQCIFFIIASGAKKIKKFAKKILTFVSQNDIIIMGENNNNNIKRSMGGSDDTRG